MKEHFPKFDDRLPLEYFEQMKSSIRLDRYFRAAESLFESVSFQVEALEQKVEEEKRQLQHILNSNSR